MRTREHGYHEGVRIVAYDLLLGSHHGQEGQCGQQQNPLAILVQIEHHFCSIDESHFEHLSDESSIVTTHSSKPVPTRANACQTGFGGPKRGFRVR